MPRSSTQARASRKKSKKGKKKSKKAGMYGDYTPEQEQEQQEIFEQSVKANEEEERTREMKTHLVNSLTMGNRKKKRKISSSQLKEHAKDISRHKEKCQLENDEISCDYCRKEYSKWVALEKTEAKLKKRERTKQKPSELRRKLAIKTLRTKRRSNKAAKRGKISRGKKYKRGQRRK